MIIAGSLAYGPKGEIPEKTLYNDLDMTGHPNLIMMPDLSTFRLLPWAGKNFQVGEVQCQTHWQDGGPQKQCPRYVALKMLQKLDGMGLKLLSAFEAEFKVKTLECLSLDNHGDRHIFPL